MASAVLPRQKTRFLPAIDQRAAPNNNKLLHKSRLKEKSELPDPDFPENEKSQTTTITEDDIARFQKPVHQNLCVSMLREGFHRSFEEFFSLLQRWKASRLVAGEDSALWQQRPLEEQPHKLETLKELLTRAESAERSNQYVEVYENYLALAKFFSEPDDRWLQHHFYKLSLLSARKVKMDSGKREAEANAHIGQLYLEQGDLELAQEHYEMFHHLAVGRSWQDESGCPLLSRACEGLWRVYTLQAQRHLQNKDYSPAIQILTKAYDMAKQGDKKIEGEAAYRVALAYQSLGDHRTAKQFLNTFVEISTALEDTASVGRAYKAIAQSLESEGKLNETIQYLQKYAEISEEINQDQGLQDACMCLGSIQSSRGEYVSACEYFIRAYAIACDLGSVPLLQKAQVSLGITRAHSMLRTYSSLVANNEPQSLLTLIRWKETREEFHKPPCACVTHTYHTHTHKTSLSQW
ncbi:tetratricopeptide repeat protein 29 isoform X2 [Pygocentrus nattereri]|uniref:tetratricopeptide repeat protein 29 isoform X2 n=1 Tax=Pygocentrus nattereri TaxID=42514 RepID=UPI000814405D|nr:tetratricopeptide repeat protein 29 isoform X2 [Pygocentrus nattereri]